MIYQSVAATQHVCQHVIFAHVSNKEVMCVTVTSDESARSTESSDSCEYYQLEIFDQLPSIQACRPDHSRQPHLGGPEPEVSHGQPPRGQRDGFRQPLRNLPLCIQAKRDARWENFNSIHTSILFKLIK